MVAHQPGHSASFLDAIKRNRVSSCFGSCLLKDCNCEIEAVSSTIWCCVQPVCDVLYSQCMCLHAGLEVALCWPQLFHCSVSVVKRLYACLWRACAVAAVLSGSAAFSNAGLPVNKSCLPSEHRLHFISHHLPASLCLLCLLAQHVKGCSSCRWRQPRPGEVLRSAVDTIPLVVHRHACDCCCAHLGEASWQHAFAKSDLSSIPLQNQIACMSS